MALNMGFHNVKGLRFTPAREFPATEDRPAFAVRYLRVTFEDGTATELPFFGESSEALALEDRALVSKQTGAEVGATAR